MRKKYIDDDSDDFQEEDSEEEVRGAGWGTKDWVGWSGSVLYARVGLGSAEP